MSTEDAKRARLLRNITSLRETIGVVAKQQAEFEKSPAAQLLVAIEARKRAKDEMVAEHSDYRSATSQRLATLDQENAELIKSVALSSDLVRQREDFIAAIQKQLETLDTRSLHESRSDLEFQKQFGLPADEHVIASYNCAIRLIRGTLFISSSYLCFSNLFNTIKIPFKAIESVSQMWRNITIRSIVIVQKDGSVNNFDTFLVDRQVVVNEIAKRADALGLKIAFAG